MAGLNESLTDLSF